MPSGQFENIVMSHQPIGRKSLKGVVFFLSFLLVSTSFSEGGRTPLRVKNGIVTSASKLASEVGVETLKALSLIHI